MNPLENSDQDRMAHEWKTFPQIWAAEELSCLFALIRSVQDSGFQIGFEDPREHDSMVLGLCLNLIGQVKHGLIFERFFNPAIHQTMSLSFTLGAGADAHLVSWFKHTYGDRVQILPIETSGGFHVFLDRKPLAEFVVSPICTDLQAFERNIRAEVDPKFKIQNIPEDQAVFESLGDARSLEELIIHEAIGELRGLGVQDQSSSRPLLALYLVPTKGVFLFKEQVIHAFVELADFLLTEADVALRECGKRKTETCEPIGIRFRQSVQAKHGVSPVEAESLFEDIFEASSRTVSKAYAFARALDLYQMAYLRRYFPVQCLSGMSVCDTH